MTPHVPFRVLIAVALFCFCRVGVAQQSTNEQAVGITFHRFVFHKDYWSAEFAVSNRTSRSVWFMGYTYTNPIYSIQYMDNGQWSEDQMGWCGNGMERLEFSTHASFALQVPVDSSGSNKTFRVGIACSSKKKYGEKTVTTYWSDKIAPR